MICLVPAWCLATKQDTQGLKTLDTKGFFYYGYYSMVEDGRTISIENKTVSTKHLYDVQFFEEYFDQKEVLQDLDLTNLVSDFEIYQEE